LALVPKFAALADDAYELPLYQAYLPWLAGAAAVGLAGGIVAAWLARRQRQWALVMLAASGFLSSQAILLGHEAFGRDKAGIAHVPAIKAELTAHTPIYAVGRYEDVLPFYLGRTLILVADPSGFESGLKQEPQLWLPTLDTFIAQWKAHHASGDKAVAIVRRDLLGELQKLGVPMRIIAQDPRRVIVTSDVHQKADAPESGWRTRPSLPHLNPLPAIVRWQRYPLLARESGHRGPRTNAQDT
jgi:hypothetical protein